ncbi:MAG: hypothetical protein JXA69_11045, partial [Phycisphaerae bacterium]|nr:hypothetical protein [Phycisphaerae bacterium]
MTERIIRRTRRGVVSLGWIVCLVASLGDANAWARGDASLVATELPPLPAPVAGAYVGTSNSAVLVAGGMRATAASLDAATPAYLDSVFILPPGAETWTTASPLAGPRA